MSYISDSLIISSPSRYSSITLDNENNIRYNDTLYISQLGIMLDLPQHIIYTACLYYHIFYYKKSYIEYNNSQEIGYICLFISSKVLESTRTISDFLNVQYSLLQFRKLNNPSIDFIPDILKLSQDELNSSVRKIRNLELIILNELGYNLYLDTPYHHLLKILKLLNKTELIQKSWNYINDMMRSWICVRFDSKILAAAAIYLASSDLKISLENEWWLLLNATTDEIEKVVNALIGNYYMTVTMNA